jgi:adenosylmethionine-8-amino-7-oxononanoate aminotransferase
MEKWLRHRDIAALIMEPVVTSIEVEIPTQEFMDRIQELCRKYGTLIIMDEVATGFGRTGRLFACEHYGLEPDIMCLAKSLTAGVAPIGATIMTEEVAEALVEENFPYSTYGWHPLSVSAAIANIKYLQENWPEIDANARSLSEYFQQRLSDMGFESEVDIRVMGPAIGLKFKQDDYGEIVAKRALKKGLIIDDGICLFPQLTMDIQTAKKGLDILEECL